MDQYLGFTLLQGELSLTGGNIQNKLKHINERLVNIKEDYYSQVLLIGYSQGSILSLEIAKSNPNQKFIVILNAPTKGLPNYGLWGKKKIDYIPTNVMNAWINYHGEKFPFFGHSIFKTHGNLDLHVDYKGHYKHNSIDLSFDMNKLSSADILLLLQTSLKRNYYAGLLPQKHIYGTNDYYILSNMLQFEISTN